MSWYSRSATKRSRWWSRIPAAIAAAALVISAAATSAAATTGGSPPDASSNYMFQTLDNPRDNTFNQLLGINQHGLIAGYFGSGMTGHPNKGYLLPNDGAGGYVNQNFPGSAQTQVTGLDDNGYTVGFWADNGGANFGFYRSPNGHFHTANFPTGDPASPAMDQLLGVNDRGIAVGFFADGQNHTHGYTYSLASHRYRQINIVGATSTTTTAINEAGDIAGFDTVNGAVEGFLRLNNGHVVTLDVPGSSMTQAFGLNDGDEVVGAYQVGTGSNATTNGFVWSPGIGFVTVNDPNGVGTTTINGVNDHGRVVGFYTDSNNNTDGFLATPRG